MLERQIRQLMQKYRHAKASTDHDYLRILLPEVNSPWTHPSIRFTAHTIGPEKSRLDCRYMLIFDGNMQETRYETLAFAGKAVTLYTELITDISQLGDFDRTEQVTLSQNNIQVTDETQLREFFTKVQQRRQELQLRAKDYFVGENMAARYG